jgi:Asp/Glu/hydantoin racemase
VSDPPPRSRVVNPNSNEDVTRGLDAALEPLRFPNGPEIVCSTLAEGPFGIETQADVESVVMPLRRMIEADNSSDAFVIDPTLAAVTMALRALQFSRVGRRPPRATRYRSAASRSSDRVRKVILRRQHGENPARTARTYQDRGGRTTPVWLVMRP